MLGLFSYVTQVINIVSVSLEHLPFYERVMHTHDYTTEYISRSRAGLCWATFKTNCTVILTCASLNSMVFISKLVFLLC